LASAEQRDAKQQPAAPAADNMASAELTAHGDHDLR
jgi:hypothetical protein